MLAGIYALYWQEQDLVYIGQSQNIKERFKEHLRKMRNNTHTNYKVQNTYDSYGEPNLEIIELTTLDTLNDLEVYWTKEFNSIAKGLNIVEAGQVGYGPYSNYSKYSKLQILKIFRELCSRSSFISFKVLGERHNVSISTIKDIHSGKSHIWLKDRYPILYSRMKSYQKHRYINRQNLRTHKVEIPIILSPEGLEYSISNIREFARDNNLSNTHLGSVLRGERKSHKGWTLK